ncbi:MAG: hypothetical protein JOS17DRAFT_161082 [Linnemannia elongata]|nr:MAG: hypothetical protein JOS17DRAFT_161082 [Linnemannia elongata]
MNDGGSWSVLHTINNVSTSLIVGPAVEFDGDVIDMDYFVPIGPGSGASTFALMRKYKELYAFGNDNGLRYTHLIKAVNVTDPIRSNAIPPPLPRPTPESSSSSVLPAVGISGIAIGVIVVIAGVLFLIVKRYRNHRKRDNAGNYAEGQRGSTETLPMAPITPIPEHMQEELRVLQEKMRVVQEQIRATQFSGLGPNVVTDVSKTTESSASGVPQSEPGSGSTTATATLKGSLGSIPDVAPNGSPGSTDLCSSSAPAYPSDCIQPSSQNSPEVERQESAGTSNGVTTCISLSPSTINTI